MPAVSYQRWAPPCTPRGAWDKSRHPELWGREALESAPPPPLCCGQGENGTAASHNRHTQTQHTTQQRDTRHLLKRNENPGAHKHLHVFTEALLLTVQSWKRWEVLRVNRYTRCGVFIRQNTSRPQKGAIYWHTPRRGRSQIHHEQGKQGDGGARTGWFHVYEIIKRQNESLVTAATWGSRLGNWLQRGRKEHSRVMERSALGMGVATQVYTVVEIHLTVHIKGIHFIECNCISIKQI